MILLFLLYTFFFAQPAQADITFPTTTTVHFKNYGEPVTSPVDFTVTCYGYSYLPPGNDPNYAPGSYTESKVYSFSDTCATSDCSIDEEYNLNYEHIDFCAVTGTVDGKDFTISNIGNAPYGACEFTKTGDQVCTSTFDLTHAFNTPKQSSAMSSIRELIELLFKSFWLALLITIIMETILLFGCVKLLFRKAGAELTWYHIISLGIILSATTLPYVWFIIPNVLLGEAFAVVCEALILKKSTKLSWFKVLITALICNVGSYLFGLLLVDWWLRTKY